MGFNLSRELQKIDDVTKLNFEKNMAKYDKLKAKIADLYY